MSEVTKTFLQPAVVMEQENENSFKLSVESGPVSVVLSMRGPAELISAMAEEAKDMGGGLLDIYRFLATGKF